MTNNENPALVQELGSREFLKKGLLWGGVGTAPFALGLAGGVVGDLR